MSEPRSAAEMLVRRHCARDHARRRRRGSPWRIALAAVAACGLFFGAVLLGASLFMAYVKGGSDTWDARTLEAPAGEPLVAFAYLFAAAVAIGGGCLFYRLKEPHASIALAGLCCCSFLAVMIAPAVAGTPLEGTELRELTTGQIVSALYVAAGLSAPVGSLIGWRLARLVSGE